MDDPNDSLSNLSPDERKKINDVLKEVEEWLKKKIQMQLKKNMIKN